MDLQPSVIKCTFTTTTTTFSTTATSKTTCNTFNLLDQSGSSHTQVELELLLVLLHVCTEQKICVFILGSGKKTESSFALPFFLIFFELFCSCMQSATPINELKHNKKNTNMTSRVSWTATSSTTSTPTTRLLLTAGWRTWSACNGQCDSGTLWNYFSQLQTSIVDEQRSRPAGTWWLPGVTDAAAFLVLVPESLLLSATSMAPR